MKACTIMQVGYSAKKSNGFATAALLAFFLCYCHGYLLGQGRQAGEIRGTVTDASGAVIPDTSVTLTNILTGISQNLLTNKAGLYDAPYVQPGQYSVTFVKTGFKQLIRLGIVLHEDIITVDAKLEIGTVIAQVVVNAASAQVETEASDHSTVLVGDEVANIPNIGRDVTAILALVPGATNQGGSSGINGAGALQTNWQIDGGKATFPANQNPDALIPPLNTIQEVKISTSNFGAEQADGLSVFNVTLKSGTNQWHGSVYEYNQNTIFNARDYFAQGTPPVHWNQFGGDFGGPIKRNKAFFYFSYQKRLQQSTNPAFYTVPTQAMRNGDFSDPGLQTIYDPASTVFNPDGTVTRTPFPGNIIPTARMDPVALKIQQYLPLPNLPGLANNFYWLQPNPFPGQWTSIKVDYQVSSNNRISSSFSAPHYSYVNSDPICAIDCAPFRENYEISGQLTDVWTISPNLFNEFRFGLATVLDMTTNNSVGKGYPGKLGLNNPGGDAFPIVTMEGTVTTGIGGVFGNGSPSWSQYELAYAPSDIFTWVRGRHTLKVGGEYDRWGQEVLYPAVNEGNFDFNGIVTRNPSDPNSAGEGYADFQLGLPGTWSVNAGADTYGVTRNWQFFGEDDYKVRPNLTVTVGLRYIRQFGWSEVNNKVSNFSPTLINPATNTPGAIEFAPKGFTALQNPVNFFAPRFGFAWSPWKDTSIRGGFGLYNYQRGAYAYAGNLGLGYGITGFQTSTDNVTPIFQLSQGPPPPTILNAASRTADSLNGQGISYYNPNTPMGYTEQYSFDVQHQFANRIVVTVGYVGNHGLHLPYNRDMNQVPPGLLGPGDAQSRRPYPQYASIQRFSAEDWSHYNSLQVTAKKDFRNGILFQANYTWAKALDTMTIAAGGSGYEAPWQNYYNISADYGPSATDLRHIFNGFVVYNLPLGKGQRFLNQGGFLNAVLGGWRSTLLVRAQSGYPFTPTIGTANLSGSLAGSWRPNRIGSGLLAHPTINEWFDPSAFVQPAPFTFGNSGRDILHGPHYVDFDLAVAKDFPVQLWRKECRLEFKAEAYNVFNHVNFGNPDDSIGTAGVGTITSDAGPRAMQLGASFSF